MLLADSSRGLKSVNYDKVLEFHSLASRANFHADVELIKGNINMNWTHFQYFSKGSIELNTVALQLAVWLRVACC